MVYNCVPIKIASKDIKSKFAISEYNNLQTKR